MGIRDVIVLGFFAASLPFCFFRPFYGVLLWTVVAFLNPHRFAWAAQEYPIALAIAIPTILGLLCFSRDWKALRTREFALLVVLWGWFTLTSVAAADNPMFVHHIGDTWEKWRFVSKVMLMTGVTMAVVNSFSRLRILVLVIAGCFGVFVLKALPFVILTGGKYHLFGPGNSMIGDNNDLGLALNMTLPLFFFLAQTESRRWVKRFFAFLIVITIPAIFCTYSRGALVGLIVVSGLMFLHLKERFLLVPVIMVAVLVVLLSAPERWKERMDPTKEGAIDGSAQARLNAWAFARNLAYDNPITGGGFATFTPELYSRYAPSMTTIVGAHSVYFGLLAEHGFVGLFLYLGLVFSCFASAHKLVKWAHVHQDDMVVKYTNMFRFSLIAFLVSGLFLGRAYFDYFFTLVACLVILKQVAYEEWAEGSLLTAETEGEAGMEDLSEWSVSHVS